MFIDDCFVHSYQNGEGGKHTRHWITKANYTYNKIRALTQRTDENGGLNTLSTIRLLHTVTRSIVWYGLEHSGENETRNKETDSFLYETIKRLFDMPANTPHRAISAEFQMTPSAIQQEYLKTRIRLRHQAYPFIMDRARTKGKITPDFTNNPNSSGIHMLNWQTEIPEPQGIPITTEDRPNPTRNPTIGEMCNKIGSHGLIMYTDGSYSRATNNSKYGIAVFNNQRTLINKDQGKLSPGKGIADAETYAIYRAMNIALTDRTIYQTPRKIYILSDSKTAIQNVAEPKKEGPLSYLNTIRAEIEEDELKVNRHIQFILMKIKGHSKDPGNDAADHLAKTATERKDPLPGTSHSKRKEDAENARQERWEEWYNKQRHHYQTQQLTRKLKRHRDNTRLDTTVLFKIKTNKGWSNDPIGIQPAPPCDHDQCGQTPDDGVHKLTCPKWENGRPANTNDDRTVVEWIRKHDHFGIRNKAYEVNYIKLKIGQFNREQDYACPDCDYISTRKHDLNRHIQSVHENPKPMGPAPKNRPDNLPSDKKCPLCQKTFGTNANRDRHYANRSCNKRDQDGTRYPCDDCDRISETKSRHNAHQTVHRKCERCNKPNAGENGTEVNEECMKDDRCGHTCHGCLRKYISKKRLRIHERSNCGGSRS